LISGEIPALLFFFLAFCIPISATFAGLISDSEKLEDLIKKYYLTASWLFWSLQISYHVLNPLLEHVGEDDFPLGAFLSVIGYLIIAIWVKKFAEQPLEQQNGEQMGARSSFSSKTAKLFSEYSPGMFVAFSYAILALVILGGFILFLQESENYAIFLGTSVILTIVFVIAAVLLQAIREE
jgi:hypothetical protein